MDTTSTPVTGISGPMRINLGCGDRYVQGWWNVDLASCPFTKDEVVDLTGELPWPERSVLLVYMGHVLEHLDMDSARALLDRLYDKVMNRGSLLIVGPDCEVAQVMAADGTLDVTMESLVQGGHRWPGDEHRWYSTEAATVALLKAAGWEHIQRWEWNDVPVWWPVADRGPRWQFALQAVKR